MQTIYESEGETYYFFLLIILININTPPVSLKYGIIFLQTIYGCEGETCCFYVIKQNDPCYAKIK